MANSSAVLKYMADDLRAISKLNQSYRYGLRIGAFRNIEDYIQMGFFRVNLKRLNKRIDMALEVIEHQTTNHTFIPQIIENIFEDLKEVYPMPEKFMVGVNFAQFPEENIELLWKFADQLEHLSTVLDFKYGLHQDPDEPRPSYWKDYNIDFDNILNKVESGEWTFQTIQNRYGALFERDQEFKDMFLRHLSQSSFYKGIVLKESEKVKDERIWNVYNTIKRTYGDVGVYIQPTPKKNPFENDFKEITDGVINGRWGHIKVKEYLKEWRTETPNIISMFLNYLNQVIYTYNHNIGEEKKEKILTELHDNILATFNNDSGIEKNQPEPKTTADFSHMESCQPTPKKKSKSIKDLMLVQEEQKEQLTDTLHSLIDGKKGKDVALVILVCVQHGLMKKPEYSIMKETFGEIGAKSGYNSYFGKGLSAYSPEEIKGIETHLSSFIDGL